MKTTNRLWIIAVLLLSVMSCSKDSESSEPNNEKGYATGKVVDGQGKPIAGAKIYLDNAPFHDSFIDGSTGEDGIYKIKVYQGAWKAYASFKREYNGKTYSIQLYPDNTNSFSEEGAVRNFTWKLEGIDPDNEHYFYGGQVTVSSDIGFYEDYEDIELTFTPSGPLIDGSEGKTIVLRYGERYWEEYYYIKDIPVGRYMVTAILKKSGGNVPLKIQNWHTKGDFVSELQLDFIPDNSDFRSTSEVSIVIGHDPDYIY